MAQSSFRYTLGDEDSDIVIIASEGTAPGGDVRVTWQDALTREQILLGLAAIRRRVLKSDWPL